MVRQDDQFILYEEFTLPHLKSTDLNQMCDGTYYYPTKGGDPVLIPNAILIITGNKDPVDLYPNCWKYISLRFNVINVGPTTWWVNGEP